MIFSSALTLSGTQAIFGPKSRRKGTGIVPQVEPNQITALRVKWKEGDQQAVHVLLPLVYEELRRLAHQYLRRERPGHTLQSTALVH